MASAMNHISMTQRGVQANEVEMANIHLDTMVHPSSQVNTSPDCSRTSCTPPSRDDSASYVQLQVLIEKQRRGRDTTAVPRLPRPSSPNAPPLPTHLHDKYKTATAHAASDHIQKGVCGGCVLWPERVLACPAIAALRHQSCGVLPEVTCEWKGSGAHSPPAHGDPPKNISLWNKVRGSITEENMGSLDGPERLDVYRYESSLASLSARGEAPTRLERALRRGARPAASWLREAMAAPRLLAALPGALLLLALRTVLSPVRDTAVGLVQTASDYVLKPALVLTFNALLQPTFSCAMHTTRACGASVQPLAALVNDLVEPAARLLSSIRLVSIERRCGCPHAV